MPDAYAGPLERIDDCRWRIPRSYKPQMRTDGVIYADDTLIASIRQDKSPEQVANVATLPGIVGASLAMPDIHWGYGFCIGGVAATDPDDGGVISPGGVGYDINCGVRLLRSDLQAARRASRGSRRSSARRCFRHGALRRRPRRAREDSSSASPSCAGLAGRGMRRFVVGLGYRHRTRTSRRSPKPAAAWKTPGPNAFPSYAYGRGVPIRCGTLGSGNHFLEIQVVEEIADEQAAAKAFGLFNSGKSR